MHEQERDRVLRENTAQSTESHDIGTETVECGYPPCKERLTLNPTFGGEGKQWCSKEHRDAPWPRQFRWFFQVKWEPRDIWLGLYWTRWSEPFAARHWRSRQWFICVVPCLPIIITRRETLRVD